MPSTIRNGSLGPNSSDKIRSIPNFATIPKVLPPGLSHFRQTIGFPTGSWEMETGNAKHRDTRYLEGGVAAQDLQVGR
jgi:hypothetical protein